MTDGQFKKDWRRVILSCLKPPHGLFVGGSLAAPQVLLGWIIASVLAGGPPLSPAQSVERPTQSERALRLQRMRGAVDDVEAFSRSGGVRKPEERLPEPILRFSDVPRENEDGAVWIWGRTGRPIAILELYQNHGGESWILTMSSLGTGPIELQSRWGWAWETAAAGLTFRPLAAPAPEANVAARLRQMKALASRFSAHEFWDPNHQRYELRLLPQPAYRYQQPAAGLVDGALFLFCHGTNAELILLIEAVRGKDGEAAWQYGIARLGHAEFHAAWDGREVWQAPLLRVLSSRDTYYQVIQPFREDARRLPPGR